MTSVVPLLYVNDGLTLTEMVTSRRVRKIIYRWPRPLSKMNIWSFHSFLFLLLLFFLPFFGVSLTLLPCVLSISRGKERVKLSLNDTSATQWELYVVQLTSQLFSPTQRRVSNFRTRI